MSFSTVPIICEPLSCQPIVYTKQRYSYLTDLDLADSSHVGDELQIDALIGSDHYWQIATGRVIQGQSGPTAIHTHLGWVLSGPVWNAAEQNTLNSQVIHTLHVQSAGSFPHLDGLLKQFWELESSRMNPVFMKPSSSYPVQEWLLRSKSPMAFHPDTIT